MKPHYSSCECLTVAALAITVALSACQQPYGISIPTQPDPIVPTHPPTPTHVPSYTSTFRIPTTTPGSTSTPYPTLHPSDARLLHDLLRSPPCPLPCFLNITPGTTSIGEAIAILDSIGATYDGQESESLSGTNAYRFTLKVGESPASTATPDPYDALIYAYVVLTADPTGHVERLHLGALSTTTSLSHDAYRQYFYDFSAPRLVAQLGTPLEIYAASRADTPAWGEEFIFDYTPKGVFVRLWEPRLAQDICVKRLGYPPEISLQIDLFDRRLGLTATTFEPFVGDPTRWLSLEQAFGVRSEEYYRRLLSCLQE